MNTEQKREHFAQLRESQVILAKVNREISATRETAERLKEKHGRDSERLLIDLETIEHYLIKLRDQLEDLATPYCEWERIEPNTYVLLLENENGNRFYYQGASVWSWDKLDETTVRFSSIGEAKGVVKELAKEDYPWECKLHIVELASGVSWFSILGTKGDDL